jgi:phospholipase C
MNRRDFLRTTAALGAATALGGASTADAVRRLPGGSLLDLPAAQSPIDTIVVCMMENRSFDHYLGWLATDETFLEEGRSRWGRRFDVNGSTDEVYRAPDGTLVPTTPLLAGGDANPWRGCGHPDPGHGWNAGRAQRDGGFLATGSGNDAFALGWYRPEDLPFYAALSRRFTTFDRMHCSLLGPTYPNREYLHSAQSGGIKKNDFRTASTGPPSGTASRPPACRRATTTSTSPWSRSGAPGCSPSPARWRASSRTPRRARCPTSSSSTRASWARPAATSIPTATCARARRWCSAS